MIKVPKDYSPLKQMIRVWKNEDTGEQYTNRIMIDFEDIRIVEEDVSNECDPISRGGELCIVRTYTGDAYRVSGSFKVICSEVKIARQYAKINNLSFIKN